MHVKLQKASCGHQNSGFTADLGKITTAAAAAVTAVTAAFTAASAAAIDIGMNYESSMSQVAATMGITSAATDFQMLSDAAKEMGEREFLKQLGIEDKDTVDKIMSENGKDINAKKNKFGDYETLKNQLSEANKKIEEFGKLDYDGVKAMADKYKADFEQSQAESKKQLDECIRRIYMKVIGRTEKKKPAAAPAPPKPPKDKTEQEDKKRV